MVLDVCCGQKMFWFDKNNSDVVFGDIRNKVIQKDFHNQTVMIKIQPDIVFNFINLPFKDETFDHIVFDPPHKVTEKDQNQQTGVILLQYGNFTHENWKESIAKGFKECLRVLKTGRILIFKWNDVSKNVKEILKLIDYEPLYGHKIIRKTTTHWLVFMKR